MKRLSLIAGALAVALMLTAPIKAQTPQQTVGSTLIRFPAPAGQCEMTGATPHEAEIVRKIHDLFSSGAQIMALYFDCDRMKLFRQNPSAGGFQDFAQYIVQNGVANRILPERVIPDVCEAARKITTTKIDDIFRSTQSKVESSGLAIKMEHAAHLGVLAEEASACYTGSVTISNRRLQLGIITNVLVQGKLITYQIYAPYRGKHSVDELLTKHKANVAAFIAANAE